MEGEVFGRGKHHVDGARRQACVHFRTLIGRAFTRKARGRQPEAFEQARRMARLVGDKRAQWVHEHARPAIEQRFACSVNLEYERLAAPRAHDHERAFAPREHIERPPLRIMQIRSVANRVRDQGSGQTVGVLRRELAPLFTALFGNALRFVVAAGQNAGVFIKLAHEIEVFGRQARAQAGARRGGLNLVEQTFHRTAALPFVNLHLKRRIDHGIARHERFDFAAVEHDGANLGRAIDHLARQVVFLNAHGMTGKQAHVARQKTRRGVRAAERRQTRERLDVLQRKLPQLDLRLNLNLRMETVFGKRIHVFAQTVREFIELRRGKRNAHSAAVAAKAGEQIGTRLYGLEQIHAAYASTRAACFVAIDGEQNRRHAVFIHQTRGDNALHALVPAFATNHERTLAMVDFRSRLFGALRKVLLNAAAFVVYLIEFGGKALRLFEIVGHQQIERQIGIAHAARCVQARNERKRQPRRGNLLVTRMAHVDKRLNARTRIFVHALQAIGDERAVLVAHGHKVGDGSQGREIGVFAPQMRLSKAGAQSLDDLQRNAHTSQNAAFAFRVALRVAYHNALRNQIARLVVVGHHQVDAFGQNR